MNTVTGMSGKVYQLDDSIGDGGEGSVFAVRGEQLVVKIYKKVTPDHEGKLRYMVSHPIPKVQDQNGNLILNAAWPLDLIYDNKQNFIGYVMPRIGNALELFQVERGCNSEAARRIFPNYTWRLNILVARNLAASVNILHSQGYVIGDMNCKNFLVNADGSISLLDTDSIDMTDPATGKHYKCCVGMEDYLPPELQGCNLRKPENCFTVETDNFALAVHIFQLLMNNYHPFSARQTVVTGSSNVNPKMQRIANGICPYLNSYPSVTIPLNAPRLENTLPNYMIQNFRNTFDYNSANAVVKASSRTTAARWTELLRHLLWEYDNGQLQPASATMTTPQPQPAVVPRKQKELLTLGNLCAIGNGLLVLWVLFLNFSQQSYAAGIIGGLFFLTFPLSILHKNYLLTHEVKDLPLNNKLLRFLYYNLCLVLDSLGFFVLASWVIMIPAFLTTTEPGFLEVSISALWLITFVYHVWHLISTCQREPFRSPIDPKLLTFGKLCVAGNGVLALWVLLTVLSGTDAGIGATLTVSFPLFAALEILYMNHRLACGKEIFQSKYMQTFYECCRAMVLIFSIAVLGGFFILPVYIDSMSSNKIFWLACLSVGVANLIYIRKQSKAINS